MKSNKIICHVFGLLLCYSNLLCAESTCQAKVEITVPTENNGKLSLVFWNLPEKKLAYAYVESGSNEKKPLIPNYDKGSYEIEQTQGNLYLILSAYQIANLKIFLIEESSKKNAVFENGSLPRSFFILNDHSANLPSDATLCMLKFSG